MTATMKTSTAAAFLFLFGYLQSFAQANVTFAAPSRYKLTVAINGRTQTADQYVRLEGLPSGDQQAQITLADGAETYKLQSTVTLPDNQETSYFVLVVGKSAQIHHLRLPAHPSAGATASFRPMKTTVKTGTTETILNIKASRDRRTAVVIREFTASGKAAETNRRGMIRGMTTVTMARATARTTTRSSQWASWRGCKQPCSKSHSMTTKWRSLATQPGA
jgi:hypothetical protein